MAKDLEENKRLATQIRVFIALTGQLLALSIVKYNGRRGSRRAESA
jgi:hypothetical protein